MIVKEKIGGLFFDLIQGDTLIENEHIKDGSVDLILTDLPYGTTACKWDTIIPFDKLWEIVNRLLKPNGVFITTASQPFTSALIMSNTDMFKYSVIWEKSHPTGAHLARKRIMMKHEDVLIFYYKQPIYNPQMTIGEKNHWTKKKKHSSLSQAKGSVFGEIENRSGNMKFPNSILYFNSPNRNGLLHPTQKPVGLLEYLIKTFSNENDLVVDLTMGSGSTGVAAKNTNRSFIGIEKDERYFNIAVSRIKGTKPNHNNFEKAEERGLFSFTDLPTNVD